MHPLSQSIMRMGGVPYEDFLLYTKVDPNAHIGVVADPGITTSSKVTLTALSRIDSAYLYKDRGAGYWNKTITALSEWTPSASSSNSSIGVLSAFANEVGEARIGTPNCIQIYGSKSGGGVPSLYLVEYDGGVAYQTGAYVVTEGTKYYLKLVRDLLGSFGNATLYIYSDAARTVLLSTLTLALHTSIKNYRYNYAVQSYNDGNGTLIFYGVFEKLNISQV